MMMMMMDLCPPMCNDNALYPTCFRNMSNQISQRRVTAKKPYDMSKLFSSMLFSFSPRVCFYLLNKESWGHLTGISSFALITSFF